MGPKPKYFNPQLAAYIETLLKPSNSLTSARRKILEQMAVSFSEQLRDHSRLNVIFICTHNSRRSHLAQLWAQTAAYHFDISHVECFSGGTEATAFHTNTVAALRRCGFEVIAGDDSNNPHYRVSFASDGPRLEMFSKKFGDHFNPSTGFIAVMTCTDADEACPFVPGAALRFSLPYEDPKKADGTSREQETYDQRCREIATEMFYLMQKIAD